MKLKVLIIDDEADAIDVLESIIEVNKHDYEIVAKTTNPVKGIELILKHKPDVVFLDIEMPELNGFQVLESIPVIDFEIIFATAYENYAIKAIKENAIDYILKPVTIPEVLDALKKVKRKKHERKDSVDNYKALLKSLNSNQLQRIKIPTSSGFELIEIDDLIYLEADGSYTTAYLKKEVKLVISKSIKQLEFLLNHNCFYRTHRSYIVNVNQLKRFDRDQYSLIMSNDSLVPLSRRRYDEFISFLEN